MKSKKKVLITGSAGFIFGNFLRFCTNSKANLNIVSLDKVDSRMISNIYYNRNNTFYIADVLNSSILDNIFNLEKPDIVIHGAAESFVESSIKEPEKHVMNNILGTQNIINSCIKFNVPKLLYVSTDEVYGDLGKNKISWNEEQPLNPRNPYSATKASGELLVKSANQTYGLDYVITRCANNYGPRQLYEKLIPKTIKSILNKTPVIVHGDGTQLREWIHVFDHCSAIINIINNWESNSIYNISSNEEISIINIINKICDEMKEGHELIKHIEDPRKGGQDKRYSVDCSKLKSLGWKPEIEFNEGIRETIKWYKVNKYFLNLKDL